MYIFNNSNNGFFCRFINSYYLFTQNISPSSFVTQLLLHSKGDGYVALNRYELENKVFKKDSEKQIPSLY